MKKRALILTVALLAASLGLSATSASAASASAPPLCAPTAVRITATTSLASYAPGQQVTMTSSITNISSMPCSVWLGLDIGYSPSFIVTNSGGHEVWDRGRRGFLQDPVIS